MILVADLDVLRNVLIKDSYAFINRRVGHRIGFHFSLTFIPSH